MNKCPICSNEKLKEDYKYCPICGIKLGSALEVPVQEQHKITSSLSYGAGNFKSITLYNDKERFERVYEIHKALNSIGLLLTPEVLKFNNINSIDEIFMIGILQDK